jgi:phage terminase large subunit-like protein
LGVIALPYGDEDGLARELATRRLARFVREFWSEVEPAAPYVDGWHIGAVCEFLTAWRRREFANAVLNLPPGTAKPVHEDEPIETPDGPRPLSEIRVGDLVKTHLGRFRPVLAVHEQGELPTIEIKTFDGRTVRTAPDHPVLTARGWVPASGVEPGRDVLVAVADAHDAPDAGVTPEEARWCGYMIGDGCSLYSSAGFTNAEPDALEDFARISEAMGFCVRRTRKAGCKASYFALSGPDGVHCQPSPVRLQLERFGLRRKSSYTKRIPPQILNGPLHVLANLLGAYWTCDGEVRFPTAGRSGVTCCATTVGYELAVDLQRAFLRLGISMRIRTRVANLKTKRQGDRYTSFQLTCDPRDMWRVARLPGLCKRKALDLPAESLAKLWHEDPVVSVEQAAPGRCRCLTVEEDSSFVVRGVAVHNSLLVDVFYPAWVWATEPGHKFISCSYDPGLGLRDAGKVRQILESAKFQRWYPEARLRTNRAALHDLWTDRGGYRFSTSPKGRGLGRHFNSASVNDPVKPQQVIDTPGEASAELETAQRWLDGTLPTRRADPATFGIMLTMQRLVANDPAGIALDRGWAHLCLPMRYVPRAEWIRGPWTAKLDQRKEAGELLHPARYSESVVRELEVALADHASAQLQQNPVPRTGGLLDEPHLRWEWVDPPGHGAYFVQLWDFAARGTAATHSAVSGQLWCRVGKHVGPVTELTNEIRDRDRGAPPLRTAPRALAPDTRYLLVDEVWGVMNVPESEEAFERAQSVGQWSRASRIVIEAKAAGIGVIQRAQRTRPNVVAFHEIDDRCKALAQLDKLDRHRYNLGEWHAGRVLLPPWSRTVPDRIDPKDGKGPDAYRKELLSFPRGSRDDRVDGASMALAVLVQANPYAGVAEALKRAR